MALEISYSPLFFENLEAILKFFDERNGSDNFSKKLLKMIHKQIKLTFSSRDLANLVQGFHSLRYSRDSLSKHFF